MMFSTKPNEDDEITTIRATILASHNLSESNPSRVLNLAVAAQTSSAPSCTPALPYQDCCKLEPEVVIGPTEFLCTTIKDEGVDHEITEPSINGNQNGDEALHTTNDLKLRLHCKVEIPDVRDTLYCYDCGEWSLTEDKLHCHKNNLLCHKVHHSEPSINVEQNLEYVEISNKSIFEKFQDKNQHLNLHDDKSQHVNQIDKKLKVTKAKKIKQNGTGELKKRKESLKERGSNSSDKIFTCNLCEKSFSKKYALNIHKSVHRIKPFSCEMCGSSFDNERACAIHILTHADIQPNDTSETLQIKREEEYQEDTSLVSNEHFYCDVDERIFEQFQAENQQLNNPCINEESQKVNQNDETIANIFPCKKEPKEEIQNDNNMFYYNVDESVFEQFQEENQQIHYYPHGDEFQEEQQRFVCVYCRKDFSNKIALLRHIQNKSCTDSKSRNGKNKHKKRKKALKERGSNEMFSCDLCNKSLTSKYSLKVHKHRHHVHRIKPFSCATCSFSFENERACAIHELKHAMEKVEKHSCNVCGRVLESREELDKHKKSHAKNTLRFICNSCGKDFSRKSNLITHIENICGTVPKSRNRKDKRKKRNIGERGFPCNLCNKSFTRQWCLDVHKHTHERKPFSCEICGQMFDNEKSCEIHELLIHAGIKAYQCNLCEKSFGYKYGLKAHMDFHRGGKPYSCDTCKRRFRYEGNLRAHIRMFHNTSKQPQKLTCDMCGKTFKCKRYIIKHIARHDEERRFACEQCPKRFCFKWDLKHHVRSKHTVGELFGCDQCGRKFTTKYYLASHERRHDGTLKKYPCDVCGKTFDSKSYLVVHKLRHQGIRNKQFSCETCGKEFENRHILKRHKIIHSDERPHLCDICGKSFKSKQSVSSHKLSHTNVRPFVCEICGSRHKTFGFMTNHMKLHDDNEHWCDYCGKKFTSKTSVVRHIFGYCENSGQKRIAMKYSIKGYKRAPRIKPFSCEICGYSFTTERARANHELKHETDKVEKHSNCNVCGRVHKSREELDKHKKSHAKNSQRYICELCGTDFSRKSYLITHIENRCGTVPKSSKRKDKRKKRKIGERGFPCNLCNKSFTRQWCLDVHKHRHESKPFSCEICGRMFDNEKACENHELVIHAGIKPHQCNQCEKAFKCKSSLKIHMEKHREDKPYSCDTCKRRFRYEGNLKAHNRMFHIASKELTCDMCDKKFNCKSYLIKHLVRHDEERRFACELCPKSFFLKCELKAHVLSKHTVGELFGCDQCGHKFTTKCSLASHKRRRHDRTLKKYPCDVCGKTFYSKSYVVVHKLRHQGIRNKRFSCETCDKGFEDSYSLKRHKVIHSDERPHSCEICGLSFKLKQSLSNHQLSHTKIRPFTCEICGGRYSTFGKRTQHMKVHDDTKRNKHWCDYCGKQFASKTSVARHIFGYCKNSGQKKRGKK